METEVIFLAEKMKKNENPLEKMVVKDYIFNTNNGSGKIRSVFLLINKSGERNMTANTDDAVPRGREAGDRECFFRTLSV